MSCAVCRRRQNKLKTGRTEHLLPCPQHPNERAAGWSRLPCDCGMEPCEEHPDKPYRYRVVVMEEKIPSPGMSTLFQGGRAVAMGPVIPEAAVSRVGCDCVGEHRDGCHVGTAVKAMTLFCDRILGVVESPPPPPSTGPWADGYLQGIERVRAAWCACKGYQAPGPCNVCQSVEKILEADKLLIWPPLGSPSNA